MQRGIALGDPVGSHAGDFGDWLSICLFGVDVFSGE
uniref:Uncharacterized protein n=1 Tax=Arundo donax TaxID=35708 RepID=A0A0A9CIE6_ARUDO